ncbi:MAG: DUF86 domain-containing protein [Kineosporiaceae bacterium]
MSPRRLDPDSVAGKLRLMEPLIDRLADLDGVTGDELRQDLDRRLVVERILTVLVETAVAVNGHVVGSTGNPVPQDYRSSFGAAAAVGAVPHDLAQRLAPSAGLRNRLAHGYGEIDLDIVAAAVPQACRDFREYIGHVSRWLLRQTDRG